MILFNPYQGGIRELATGVQTCLPVQQVDHDTTDTPSPLEMDTAS